MWKLFIRIQNNSLLLPQVFLREACGLFFYKKQNLTHLYLVSYDLTFKSISLDHLTNFNDAHSPPVVIRIETCDFLMKSRVCDPVFLARIQRYEYNN